MEPVGFPSGSPPRNVFELLAAWGRGERSLPTWIALGGLLVLIFMASFDAFQLLG